MVFNAAFNSISVISRQQLTLFMLSWVSPVLGWALKCLAQGHSHEKSQRIQCGSNPGPLSNTLPLSHAGPSLTENCLPFLSNLKLLSANSFNLEENLSFGNRLQGSTLTHDRPTLSACCSVRSGWTRQIQARLVVLISYQHSSFINLFVYDCKLTFFAC